MPAPGPAGIRPRVYVPDETGSEVLVIDPATFKIVDRIKVRAYPEHISPDWDGTRLYVNNMKGGLMTIIDPVTGKATGEVKVASPYNLYFSPGGDRAIVVQDMIHGAPDDANGLQFFERATWKKLAFLPIPWAGADHLDFSADGRTLFLSCEYSGRVVSVDVASMSINTSLNVGGLPTDVRLAPDGHTVWVANQSRNGIDVIDADTFDYVTFIKLQKGAHGLAVSRDAKRLFVTNRWAGTLSVIDFATRKVVATWTIGGTPDMIAVSLDGTQLWISNRYSGTVSVVDSSSGRTIATIKTGANPHGLAFWPVPGRYSLGHNGNMR